MKRNMKNWVADRRCADVLQNFTVFVQNLDEDADTFINEAFAEQIGADYYTADATSVAEAAKATIAARA